MGTAFGVGEGFNEEVVQNALANNEGCIQRLAPNGQEIIVSLTQKMGQSGLAINRGMNSKRGAKEQPLVE